MPVVALIYWLKYAEISACHVLSCQDGDLSTSWTCTGDPREPDDDGITFYECEIGIGLVYFRHIKQVKIGESSLACSWCFAAVCVDASRCVGLVPRPPRRKIS